MKSFSCILIALGVCAGAFGAHGLKDTVTPERLEVFKTAANYQILISLLLFNLSSETKIKPWTLRLLCFGIIVFSFSLYLLVMLDLPKLGAITPIGGLSIIVSVFTAAFQLRKQ